MTCFAKNRLAAVVALGWFGVQAVPVCMAQDSFIMVGTIVTMDQKNSVQKAVGVDQDGLIVAVGTEDAVKKAMQKRNLAFARKVLPPGTALMPGFIDPHMHAVAVALQKSGAVGLLNPCLPEPYNQNSKDCYYTIENALKDFGAKFYRASTSEQKILGQNLDPSRQPYSKDLSAEAFKAEPAKYIAQTINEPNNAPDLVVAIFDQSGHFGYVNEAAFRALPPDALPPTFTSGGAWPLKTPQSDPSKPESYTGLLVEPDSFGPILKMMVPPESPETPTVAAKGMTAALDSWRAAGVTTVVSMVASAAEYKAAKAMTELPASNVRIGLVVTPELTKDATLFPNQQPQQIACQPWIKPCVFPKYLGATGVKTILDGSTQACTAAVQPPSDYTPHSGCIEGSEDPEDLGNVGLQGRLNLNQKMLTSQLADLWALGTWRFESHANGNRAMRTALATYNALNAPAAARHNKVVIIHATVGDDDATLDNENVWANAGALIKGVVGGKKQAPLKLAFTHTIGHVPYWGGRFEQVLGYHAAQNVDPFAWDKKYGIPYSMNSDAMVTASIPLFFVQQAVTRETWVYPNLEAKYSHVLGPQHKLTVTEALRAITINPAREKELDKAIGSIEKGKVADFVLLRENPLTFGCGKKCKPANQIAKIEVCGTWLGGKPTAADTCLK